MRLLIDIKDQCGWKGFDKNFHIGAMLVQDDWEHGNGCPCGYTDFRNFSEAKAVARYELLAKRVKKVVEDFYSSEDTEVIISTKSK